MGDWKLIEWFETGRRELYNLNEDLGETNNLAETHPDKLQELHQAMIRWRKAVEAPIPTTPNPQYDPQAAAKKKGKREARNEGSPPKENR
jgi:hypothetical protein